MNKSKGTKKKLTLLSSARVGWVFKGGFSSLIKRIFLLKIGINEQTISYD